MLPLSGKPFTGTGSPSTTGFALNILTAPAALCYPCTCGSVHVCVCVFVFVLRSTASACVMWFFWQVCISRTGLARGRRGGGKRGAAVTVVTAAAAASLEEWGSQEKCSSSSSQPSQSLGLSLLFLSLILRLCRTLCLSLCLALPSQAVWTWHSEQLCLSCLSHCPSSSLCTLSLYCSLTPPFFSHLPHLTVRYLPSLLLFLSCPPLFLSLSSLPSQTQSSISW